ncbi:MAG: discoidin domain-containing protein [Candidatus Aminicenantes bacterium]|nr:discoidin domain-containing protein [Candidatus Aminicenantes bacterium]
MKKIKIYYRTLICLICFLFIYDPPQAYGDYLIKNNLLSLAKETYVLHESSHYSRTWAAIYLIGGKSSKGWCSKENSPFPHIIVFELKRNAIINLIKFNNNTQEDKYPGVSSKEVRVEFSTISPDSGYSNVRNFTLEKGAKLHEFSIQKTKARWVRLTIISNYGYPHFTGLMEFEAWGIFESKILQAIPNFIWIMGLAIILTVLSYNEFLIYSQKTKIIAFYKKNSFKKPFLLGLLLISIGISFSIQQLWLALIAGSISLLLIIWFIKLFKSQEVEEQEVKD